MKHLIKFNELLYNLPPKKNSLWDRYIKIDSEIIKDLKDICLELKDEGYEVTVFDYDKLTSRLVEITLPKGDMMICDTVKGQLRSCKIINPTVKEVIERIKDYMKQKGYQLDVDLGRYYALIFVDLIRKCDNVENEHLKPYNEEFANELPDNVTQELKDICLELNDIGFTIEDHIDLMDQVRRARLLFTHGTSISSNKPIYNGPPFLRIVKYGHRETLEHFKYEQISEVIERIKDYMSSLGYYSDVRQKTGIPDKGFYEIKIEFHKFTSSFWQIESLNTQSNYSYNQPSEEIIQDLKDICLEITDEGFEIGFRNKGNPLSNLRLWVRKKKWPDASSDFTLKEISETISRIRDYMNSVGYSTTISSPTINGKLYSVRLAFRYKGSEKFNESIKDDIRQEIKDICLELNDMGFATLQTKQGDQILSGYQKGQYADADGLKIVKFGYRHTLDYFKYEEVKEVIERIIDYISPQGYRPIVNLQKGSGGEIYQVDLKFPPFHPSLESFNFKNIFKKKNKVDKQDLLEICYELNDVGYDSYVYMDMRMSPNDNKVYDCLCIIKKDSPYRGDMLFNFEEIREVVLRLMDYLGDHLVDIQIDQRPGSSHILDRILSYKSKEFHPTSFGDQNLDGDFIYKVIVYFK